MRIVNIIQRYYPAIGGSETWCQGMCRYLARKGHDVRVLTLDVYNEDEYWSEAPVNNCIMKLGKIDCDQGVWVRRYRSSKKHWLVWRLFDQVLYHCFKVYFYGPHSFEMYLKMIGEIRRADIVHLHTAPYPHNLLAYFVGRFFLKQIVFTPHFHPGHRFYELKINYWLMRNCDALFAVSDYEKEYFISKGLPENKISVVYNAITPQEYQPCGLEAYRRWLFEKHRIIPDTKIILFIGRKIEYKGVDTLIEATRKLLRTMDVRLFLVGPNFPWFTAFYNQLSPEEKARIIDLGVVEDQQKVNLLHLADVLALPSRHEAFGIVFLEAWICGVPVIGADTGVMPQLIKGSGLVARYGDSDDLREKLETLLSKDGLGRQMAANGKNKVLQSYVWDKVGEEIIAVYQRLLGNRPVAAKK